MQVLEKIQLYKELLKDDTLRPAQRLNYESMLAYYEGANNYEYEPIPHASENTDIILAMYVQEIFHNYYKKRNPNTGD